jgi:hypothetical protein
MNKANRLVQSGFVPEQAKALVKTIGNEKAEIAALSTIATPGSATAADCATAINAIIAALKA